MGHGSVPSRTGDPASHITQCTGVGRPPLSRFLLGSHLRHRRISRENRGPAPFSWTLGLIGPLTLQYPLLLTQSRHHCPKIQPSVLIDFFFQPETSSATLKTSATAMLAVANKKNRRILANGSGPSLTGNPAVKPHFRV
jgi:hypothetical protein